MDDLIYYEKELNKLEDLSSKKEF